MLFTYPNMNFSQYNTNHCQTNTTNMFSSINNTGNASDGQGRKNKHPLESNLAPLDNRPPKRRRSTENYSSDEETEDYSSDEETDISPRNTLIEELIGVGTCNTIREACFPDDGSDLSGSMDRYELGLACVGNCSFSLGRALNPAENSIMKNQVFKDQPLSEEEHWHATYGPEGVKPFEKTLQKWGHLEGDVHVPTGYIERRGGYFRAITPRWQSPEPSPQHPGSDNSASYSQAPLNTSSSSLSPPSPPSWSSPPPPRSSSPSIKVETEEEEYYHSQDHANVGVNHLVPAYGDSSPEQRGPDEMADVQGWLTDVDARAGTGSDASAELEQEEQGAWGSSSTSPAPTSEEEEEEEEDMSDNDIDDLVPIDQDWLQEGQYLDELAFIDPGFLAPADIAGLPTDGNGEADLEHLAEAYGSSSSSSADEEEEDDDGHDA